MVASIIAKLPLHFRYMTQQQTYQMSKIGEHSNQEGHQKKRFWNDAILICLQQKLWSSGKWKRITIKNNWSVWLRACTPHAIRRKCVVQHRRTHAVRKQRSGRSNTDECSLRCLSLWVKRAQRFQADIQGTFSFRHGWIELAHSAVTNTHIADCSSSVGMRLP